MHVFRPRQLPYDSIVIEGHSGYVSLQALHWLSRNNIPAFVMNYEGSIISSILPPMPVKPDLRIAQIRAIDRPERKFAIAQNLVHAKLERSMQVLEWLGASYMIGREHWATKIEAMKLGRARTTAGLRTVEAHVAQRYWEAFRKVLPSRLGFRSRLTLSGNYNASDPVNLALNYGYGFLQGEVRMAINSVGLEPAVGFLHDSADYQTKESLVFDLMEPFRFLIDLVVLQAFGAGKLDSSSFYYVESDYRYMFESEAKGRFLELLRNAFNSRISYHGKMLRWDTVIQEKAVELGRFLKASRAPLAFQEPKVAFEKSDSKALKEAIENLTNAEARKRGITKQTMFDLRKRARTQGLIRVYGKTRHRLIE
jgi:CRISPR-associated protein Cas1